MDLPTYFVMDNAGCLVLLLSTLSLSLNSKITVFLLPWPRNPSNYSVSDPLLVLGSQARVAVSGLLQGW